jgi:hypothetical protein
MKTKLLILSFLLFSPFTKLFSQETTTQSDKKWRLEVEPLSFIYKGVGGQAMYQVSKKQDFNVGLYAITLQVPGSLEKSLFQGTSDGTDIRLGFELAAVARYKIPLFKTESNPVVGIIAGWENFQLTSATQSDLRIETFLTSLYVGYELYVFKKMLYVNPQLRGVTYIKPWSADNSRPEKLKSFALVPSLSIGVRF